MSKDCKPKDHSKFDKFIFGNIMNPKRSKPFYPGMKPEKDTVVSKVLNKRQKQHAIPKASAKVPVVLGDTTIQINLDATIEFKEPVLEIEEVSKHLRLTQCRLLLPTNKLFIKGFIRKNIQYATPKSSTPRAIVSRIHALTTNIPFEAVTEIEFVNQPQFTSNPETREFIYLSASKFPQGFFQKEKLLSAEFSQYNQISGEVFNEHPYCELLSSNFIECNETLDREMGRVIDSYGKRMRAPFECGTFTKLKEKTVVELTLKVLQNQQVNIGRDYH